MALPSTRVIIAIYGPSGAGKSHLAKALVEHLGLTNSVRIPADYYLAPADPASPNHLQQPLCYDWPLLTETLALPEGIATTTPDFDFETFHRRANTGGRPITMRRIAILDAIYPYPHADLRILLTIPTPERHARIIARDAAWGARVADRWHYLEAARARLETLQLTYDLMVSGTTPPARNAATVATLLRQHNHQ